MSRSLIVGILLILVTLLVYLPVWHYPFVNYDDEMYVTGNPMVQAGLTWTGVQWAFTTLETGNWHPLTWLSLMLDRQLFGLNAGGCHLVNVLFHTANTALLFVLLLRLTGTLWPSVFIAALFGLHPLHVESVAWISERKDVLSTFFFMLTLMAYTRYAQRRSRVEGREPGKVTSGGASVPASRSQSVGGANVPASRLVSSLAPPSPTTTAADAEGGSLALDSRLWSLDYSLALFFFALGLMSKPMLVTVPFVFLLLDYWPLRRVPNFELRISHWPRLVWEKWPFFLLVALSCVVTFVAQKYSDAVFPLQAYPLSSRIGNAAITYIKYLGMSICPVDLAVIYPLQEKVVWGQVVGAVALLTVITGLVWRLRTSGPYLLVGWFWYLGMLIPVIGVVQVGVQALADRYMYLPLVGLSIGVIFGLAELAEPWRFKREILITAGGIVLAGCLWGTARQLQYWRNSETLFEHALAVTKDNPVAQGNLGGALERAGHPREAMEHFREVLRLEPDAEAYNNMGSALAETGRLPDAVECFQKALQLDPHSALAHNNLGMALAKTGQLPAAIQHFQEALQSKPDYASAHSNLGMALAKTGQLPAAIQQFQEALRFEPDSSSAHNNLAIALLQTGQLPKAIQHFQEALRLNPDSVEAHYDLGVALTQVGRPAEAIPHFRQALQAGQNNPIINNALGLALLHCGQSDEAIAEFRTALQSQPDFDDARKNLGDALFHRGWTRLQTGHVNQALADLQESLQLRPDNVDTQINLAWILATCPDASFRNGAQAVKLAERANQLSGSQNPSVLDALAAAYAEVGRFADATATARRALQMVQAATDVASANHLRKQISCYEKGLPFRDNVLTNATTHVP